MPPTPEQLDGLTRGLKDLCCVPSSSMCQCEYKDVARAAWDYVLEQAALALTGALVDANKPGWEIEAVAIDTCARRIRGMKGAP